MRDNTEDFRSLFLNDVPLMDVRAPVEFDKGAFPQSVNLPLMVDVERQKVGTMYKQQGQQAAIALGHSLVCGKVKQARVDAWLAHVKANPEGYLYCFRGGLRSQLVQQWLADAGVQYPRVVGGYKAMRRFLVDTLDAAALECSPILVAGMTGTGKTEVITALDNSLDLEGRANHRGSSFGRHATPQPAQIDFENRLAIDALKLRAAGVTQIVLEDEGRIVGSCSLPLTLYREMQEAPLVWLEDSFENRVTRILGDYVVNMLAEYRAQQPGDPEAAFAAFETYLLGSLQRIYKRLGGDRHSELNALMEAALAEQKRTGDVHAHRGWIEGLLTHYYDPMYVYQRENKRSRVVFSGDQAEIVAWLRDQHQRQA
jgi:tRNA 2-selenouridine synthase